MEFMTVKEAATKWGLSERRLQTICNEGMIPGVNLMIADISNLSKGVKTQ